MTKSAGDLVAASRAAGDQTFRQAANRIVVTLDKRL